METTVRNTQHLLFPQKVKHAVIPTSGEVEINSILHRYLNQLFKYSRSASLKKIALVCDSEATSLKLREDLNLILKRIISGVHSNSIDMFIQEQQAKNSYSRSRIITIAKRFAVAINKNAQILRIDTLEGLIKKSLKDQFSLKTGDNLDFDLYIKELESRIEGKVNKLLPSKFLSKGSSDHEYYLIEEKLHLCIDSIQKNWPVEKDFTLEKALKIYRKDLISLLGIQAEIEKVYRNLCQSGEGLLQHSKLQINDFKYGYKGGIGWYFLTGVQQDLFTKMKSRTLRDVDSELIAPKHTQNRMRKKLMRSIKPGIESIIGKIGLIQGIHGKLLSVVDVIEKDLRQYFLFRGIANELQDAELLGSRINLIELDRLVSKMALNNSMPFSFDCQGGQLKHFVVDSAVESRSLNWTKILPLLDLSFDVKSSALELIDVLLGSNLCGRGSLKSSKRFPINSVEMSAVGSQIKSFPKRNNSALPNASIYFRNKAKITDQLEKIHSSYMADLSSSSKSTLTRFKVKINSNTGVQFNFDLMVQRGNKIILLDIIDHPDQAVEGVEKWHAMMKKVKPFVKSKLEYQQLDCKGELFSKSA